mmetsp:Transcript_13701/g.29658  ORF Transcript_13701/g.29658 Transcript_13701/m.29658 type:complete len:291 (+) Transcript_13701:1024-1896(+)
MQRGEIDGLEDLLVDQSRTLRIEGKPHVDEGISETLHAEPDGAVAEVGDACLLDRVVVGIDDTVEIARHVVRDVVQLLVVEDTVGDEARQGDGREVAYSDLFGRSELDDLGAQIGRTDGAEILLIGLAVGRILVQHVRRARLDLRVKDCEPERLRGHRSLRAPFFLIPLVQLLELFAPHVTHTGRLVRAEEAPLAIRLDTPHEEVRNPQRIEEVARAALLLSVILPQVEERKDVGVPRLDVYGECAFALATALVDVARSVVKDTEHRNQAIARTTRTLDVRTLGADVVHR